MEEIKPKEVKEEKRDPLLEGFLKDHRNLIIKYGYDFCVQLEYSKNALIPVMGIMKLSDEQLKELKEQKNESK